MRHQFIKRVVTMLTIIVLLFGYSFFKRLIAVTNVVAEIMYSIPTYAEAKNGRVPSQVPNTNTVIPDDFALDDFIPWKRGVMIQREPILNENETLFLDVSKKFVFSDIMEGRYSIFFTEEAILTLLFEYRATEKVLVLFPVQVKFTYGLESYKDAENIEKFMKMYNITKEDISMYQYTLLYEKILPSWFEKNAETSKFSMDDIGRIRIIDKTFKYFDDEK